jgi:hypothetical protein
MTRLLAQAVAEIEKLPEDAQDAIAARLLADLEDERAWSTRFAATSESQWKRMADLVRQEAEIEDTIPLEEILPADSSQS